MLDGSGDVDELSVRARAPVTSARACVVRRAFFFRRVHPRAQLMYKLRKELGEDDFNRIFDNVKVKGVDIDF